MLWNIRSFITLRSAERLRSFNKSNRGNRSGEKKLNAGFRDAYFFFFRNKRVKLLNQSRPLPGIYRPFFYYP